MTSPVLTDTMPKASSRDRILLSAKTLFATRGYENTSTVAIARMAGTSESQLVKHFRNKEGLLEAIFDQAWQQLVWAVQQSIQDLPSPALKLATLVEMALKGLEKDPQVKFLMLLEGRRVRKEGQKAVVDRGFLEFLRIIDSVLAEMTAAGQLTRDFSIQAIRSTLMGMLEGLLRDQMMGQRMDYPARYSSREIHELFNHVLKGFLVKRRTPVRPSRSR